MTLPINSVVCGDNLTVMKTFEDNSIDAIVTDPPYALVGGSRGGSLSIGDKTTPYGRSGPTKNGVSIKKGFMGKEWDGELPGIETWEECLRVAKPGAHMLAFGGTRTHHRLMVAIEDAGWEIRDCIMWVYGTGFPKSTNISKQLDKNAGVEREVIGTGMSGNPQSHKTHNMGNDIVNGGYEFGGTFNITLPATDAAKQWNGWGSALKPAWEPVILFRKPLDGTIANNILKWGVGGINIEACRVTTTSEEHQKLNDGRQSNRTIRAGEVAKGYGMKPEGLKATTQSVLGRFPANFIHDGSDEVIEMFPNTQSSKGKYIRKTGDDCFLNTMGDGRINSPDGLCDSGSAARFFYSAKASRSERDAGLNDFVSDDARTTPMAGRGQAGLKCKLCGHWKNSGSPCTCENPEWEQSQFVSPTNKNVHPTVKPLSLMQYLTKLITPKNGIVLDPFTGSGSTCIAAVKEGFNYIGIEKEAEYVEIAEKRIAYYKGLKDVTD